MKGNQIITEKIQRSLMTEVIGMQWTYDTLSACLGKEPSSYKKYFYLERSMPLDSFIGVMVEARAIQTLDFIGRLMGAVVIELPQSADWNGDYLRRASTILSDTGATMKQMAESLSDDVYTAAEKRKTRKLIKDSLKHLIELDQMLKSSMDDDDE